MTINNDGQLRPEGEPDFIFTYHYRSCFGTSREEIVKVLPKCHAITWAPRAAPKRNKGKAK